jgi:hypothetical protein
VAIGFLVACGPGAAPGEQAAPQPLVASSTSAIRTASDFVRRLPESSTTVTSADGARLVHVSGFSFDTGLPRAEDAAAAFLAGHGAAFGVTDRHALALVGEPPAGPVAAVHVGRSIDGLPVFGGDLVVGVAAGKVFQVNAADVPPAISGSHAILPELADQAARAAIRGGSTSSAPARVVAGWRPFLDAVRAVYRVDLVTAQPPGDWRLWVDGVTGTVLFREDLRFRASAPGKVYEVSPVETSAKLCPLSGGRYTRCASPVAVTFDHLDAATSLVGSQTGVWNCMGGGVPGTSDAVTTACAAVAPVAGSFDFPPDGTGVSLTDDFAAAMAYEHLDRHVSFFKALDPSLPGNAQNPASRAINGSLPALVNVTNQGPLDNAFFSGALDAMVFGQGTSVDFAYDATVMYHEFTHGVVHAWGGFDPNVDAMGGLDEPGAVNEGTADAMAASETGRSAIGAFIGPSMGATPVLRNMADPGATRTCRGNGARVTRFGLAGVVNGLDGEVHDDGEIWNGFYWEIFQGLKAKGWKGCSGSCDAAPAIQYAALKLGAGTFPTFATYWANMKSAATALFADHPEVSSYLDCVGKRRGMDQCDRTAPLYRGETKLQYVRLRYSPFQISFTADASGTATLDLCSGWGTSTTIHARKGQPVALSGLDPVTLAATVTADTTLTMAQPCSSGSLTLHVAPGGAGTWYLLFDSPSGLVGASPGYDIFKVSLSGTGVAARPAATAVPTCIAPAAPAPLAISPATATVKPNGSRKFTASGGSGAGYAWSLQASPSGGTIEASTGMYTAGATVDVTDVVMVTDSASGTATVNVAVKVGTTGGGGDGGGSSGGCASGQGLGALSLLIAATGLARRRRGGPAERQG